MIILINGGMMGAFDGFMVMEVFEVFLFDCHSIIRTNYKVINGEIG